MLKEDILEAIEEAIGTLEYISDEIICNNIGDLEYLKDDIGKINDILWLYI